MGITGRHISTFILCFIAAFATAQERETPEVHRINGSKYYLHVVEAGNTIYGISRDYEVSVEEIQKENEQALRDGLKVNQTLLIPVTGSNKKELPPVVQEEGFLIHTVQPGQTLYSISREYNSKLEDILEANPAVAETGLQAMMQIRIPTEKIDVKKELIEPAAKDSLDGHVVQPGETLYGIMTKYNTTQPEILAANPGLTSELRVGEVIRIPGTSVKLVKEEVIDTVDSIIQHVPDSSGVYRVGLLLPLNPTFPDSSNRHDFRINAVSRIALEYYRGFQYALDSLDRRYNISINLHVFSAMNDSVGLNMVYKDPYFDSLDILVGPFYTSQFEEVADRLLQKGVTVICPVNKPSKILFKRPNTVKTTPSESMQINALASYVASELNDSNLILINSNKFRDTQNIEFFKERYAHAMNVPDTFIDDAIREIQFWDIDNEAIRMRFPDSGDYVLIVPSTDQVYVTKLLSGLYEFTIRTENSYRFTLFGLSEWQKWDEGLDIKQLHRLNVSIPLVNHIDQENYKVAGFFKDYVEDFGYEPSDYTFQGYDLCSYLHEQLSANPKQWFKSPELFNHKGVGFNYEFRRVLEDSGIENQYTQFYMYKDYRLKLIGEWPSTKNK